mmetsp:Transcript_53841/g.61253  ORF Transcript_53841/g.61253 Transcript_53841/m.61253 type:complete len:555 (+) Transcript_53841:55-1719(+)
MHVRPKIQRKLINTNKSNDSVMIVEDTRNRMESWMGLGNKKKDGETSSSEKPTSVEEKSTVILTSKIDTGVSQIGKQPESILRSPKYSNKNVAVEGSTFIDTSIISSGNPTIISPTEDTLRHHQQEGQTIVSTNFDVDNSNNKKKVVSAPAFVCKNLVIERKIKSFRTKITYGDVANSPSGNIRNSNNGNSTSIEGYVPTTTGIYATTEGSTFDCNDHVHIDAKNNNDKNKVDKNDNTDVDTDPVVIDSLEDLMQAAGETLPDNKITDDTKVVEADISFSVMTKDQYESKLPIIQQEHEEERRQQLEVFMGRHDIFDDDDEENETIDGGANINDDDNDDDDAIMELLMGLDINSDDDDGTGNDDDRENSTPKVRAFTLLWNALTKWMTHETVVWVKLLRDSHEINNNTSDNRTSTMSMDIEWTPMVDRSDIGASRCAGVLAMIRLYLGGCIDELNQQPENRRRAEKRLNDIMRTFDYSEENPKLTASHWKAMACILLDMVLIETRSQPIVEVTPSVSAVGMTLDEFEYLSRKAVLAFDPVNAMQDATTSRTPHT